MSIEPPGLHQPGDLIRVEGSGFLGGCEPGGPADGSAPLSGVRLHLVQGERRVSLAMVSAEGVSASFAVEVGVPDSAEPGEARIEASRGADGRGVLLATRSIGIADRG